MDLADELAGGSENESSGVGLARERVGGTRWGRAGTIGERGGENGKEEATRLPRTSLCGRARQKKCNAAGTRGLT